MTTIRQQLKQQRFKERKLGKKMKLQYIPFYQLVNPWKLCLSESAISEKVGSIESMPIANSRSLGTMKRDDLEALKLSIMRYGLLNPLVVVKLSEEQKKEIPQLLANLPLQVPKDENFYVIVDGQRRYFAILELFARGNTTYRVSDNWLYGKSYDKAHRAKFFHYSEKTLDEKKISLYTVLIPCLVYPYKTWEKMRRHSVEDNKFSVKPSTCYLDLSERLRF